VGALALLAAIALYHWLSLVKAPMRRASFEMSD
jgi:hypothetical protein